MAFTQVIKTLGSVMASMKTAVDSWLSQNITNPSNPPLDRSLSLSNACAPADMVGNIQDELITDKSIYWNQLSSQFTRASGTFGIGVSYTRSADKLKATFNGTSTGHDFYQIINTGLGRTIAGHKYFIMTPNARGVFNQPPNNYFFYFCSRSDARDFGQGASLTA